MAIHTLVAKKQRVPKNIVAALRNNDFIEDENFKPYVNLRFQWLKKRVGLTTMSLPNFLVPDILRNSFWN